MGTLQLNKYTTISFQDGRPTAVVWALSDLHGYWPEHSELVWKLRVALKECGFVVEISKPGFKSEDPVPNLYATIKVL